MGEAQREAETEPKGRLRWSRLWPLVPIALGLLLTGFGAYRLYFPPGVEPPTPMILPTTNETEVQEERSAPDVLGLTEDHALAAFRDAGADINAVTITEAPHIAPPGTVVAQQPISGVSLTETTEVTLIVAKPATMPDLVGMTVTEADRTLSALGVAPEIVEVVTSQTIGSVLETEPAAGQPIGGPVQISVASEGDAVYLYDLRSVEYSRANRQQGMVSGGRSTDKAILLSPRGEDQAFADYAIAGRAVVFRATLGTNDRGAPGSLKVTVTGDGRVLGEFTAERGARTEIDVDVTGVTRLVLAATLTDPQADERPDAVLADAHVVGSTADIDAIVGSEGR